MKRLAVFLFVFLLLPALCLAAADDEIIACRLHESHHVKVILRHGVTHVRQLNDKADVSSRCEISLHQICPAFFLVEIDLCIAVAR